MNKFKNNLYITIYNGIDKDTFLLSSLRIESHDGVAEKQKDSLLRMFATTTIS